MPSVTSQVYATNICFLRRDNFLASEGRVQAFRRIDDDRGNLLLLCAEAQLDFCPLQLSLRLLSLSIAIPHNLRTGWARIAVGFTGRRSRVPLHIRSPAVVGIHWSLQSTH